MATFSRVAILDWHGDVTRGAGQITAGSEAFSVAATFPRLAGDPAGATTPEELLAASHATCFGIGLRSVLGHRGGHADRIRVKATVRAQKGGGRIRVEAADLVGIVEGLHGVDPATLEEIGRIAEEACTISALLRPTAQVSVILRAALSPDEEW